MEAKIEVTQPEFQKQLKEVEARAKRGRGTGTSISMEKFEGTTTSWATYRHQFQTIAKHDCWTHLKKYTYLITALQVLATNVLH